MWKWVVVSLVLGTSPVKAEQFYIPLSCAPVAAAEQFLKDNNKEELVSYGVTYGNALAELWVSEENGTWVIMLRRVNGELCLMSAGSGWRDVSSKVKGTGL